jgi:hypothetical protein
MKKSTTMCVTAAVFAVAGACAYLEGEASPEAMDAAADAVTTVGGVVETFVTPFQAVIGNAITAITTAVVVMLRRNATRARALDAVAHPKV